MRYEIIYADPPWRFQARTPAGNGKSASRHYPTMSTADICALPVADVAAPNSVLFLWAVDPLLPAAFEVIKAWGFRPVTVAFYWVKTNANGSYFVGTGYTTRANPEICLLAKRGAGLVRAARDVRRLVVAPRGRHSAKPAEVRTRIERLYGPRRRLELFARERVNGWHCWGNEVSSDVRLGSP